MLSRYKLQDLIGVELGRKLSVEYSEPLLLAIGRFGDWDLSLISGKVRWEVKLESTPKRTRNACLEYWNFDLHEPSGILGSKASRWIHVILEDDELTAYEFDIHSIRRLAIEAGSLASNGRNSLCKLIPLDLFKKAALRSFPLDTAFKEEILADGGISSSTNKQLPRAAGQASAVLRDGDAVVLPITSPRRETL